MTHTLLRGRTAIAAALGLGLALAAPLAATAGPPAPGTTPAGGSETITTTASVDASLTTEFETYGDTSGRWTGADSAYSVPLPGGKIAWLYSDTFLGTVNADHSRPTDSPFVHNSIVVDDRHGLTTHTGGTTAAPASLVQVPGGDENQDWYWFGDGTVEGNHLRVTLLEFVRTGDQPFDFAFKGTAVASFSLRTMALEGITKRPAGTVQWGSAIYEDGGYTYVYGVEDLQSTKYLHLARVRTNHLTTKPWEFWTGSGWSAAESASARIMDGVSNEFSVTKFQGRYTLVTGDTTEILSAKVVMYRSDSLTGPFTNKTLLYTTPETGGNVFTYNAKAHPELGDRDTLLVTYNVNSFSTDDVYANVDNYRPRYIDVDVAIRRRCPEGTTSGRRRSRDASAEHGLRLALGGRDLRHLVSPLGRADFR
ncbi:DUF4185 domain-containing protein [Leifsonia sp. NPDC058292]|uniref:DUF4185 domain-containing protein n=1 Tax=Leifsonia sp. NPDC058292 TaxID=3346428 RepID=UPI0036D8ABC3